MLCRYDVNVIERDPIGTLCLLDIMSVNCNGVSRCMSITVKFAA